MSFRNWSWLIFLRVFSLFIFKSFSFLFSYNRYHCKFFVIQFNEIHVEPTKSSEKAFQKFFAKFTGKHNHGLLFLVILKTQACNCTKKWRHHIYFPVKFTKFFIPLFFIEKIQGTASFSNTDEAWKRKLEASGFPVPEKMLIFSYWF